MPKESKEVQGKQSKKGKDQKKGRQTHPGDSPPRSRSPSPDSGHERAMIHIASLKPGEKVVRAVVEEKAKKKVAAKKAAEKKVAEKNTAAAQKTSAASVDPLVDLSAASAGPPVDVERALKLEDPADSDSTPLCSQVTKKKMKRLVFTD